MFELQQRGVQGILKRETCTNIQNWTESFCCGALCLVSVELPGEARGYNATDSGPRFTCRNPSCDLDVISFQVFCFLLQSGLCLLGYD